MEKTDCRQQENKNILKYLGVIFLDNPYSINILVTKLITEKDMLNKSVLWY
jgi:hypothetical protein